MIIEQSKVVGLKYSLFVPTENGNQLIEETSLEHPFEFLFGMGGVLPKFEEELKGKSVGDEFSFVIPCDQAYGQHEPNDVVELPKNVFAADGNLPEEVKAGQVLAMNDDKGNTFDGMVRSINEDTVTMDFNHPLAGLDLHFNGSVLSVRDASKEELEHGHVHGPDGHHHH
jgi:FKBP-type peptidyl-prolyl cis-trans isomerase SlyD